MKRAITSSLFWPLALSLGLGLVAPAHGQWTVIQLTDNSYNDQHP